MQIDRNIRKDQISDTEIDTEKRNSLIGLPKGKSEVKPKS